MQLARSDKYKIPLNATDITPGSQYRTPASAQASVDALQRNIVSEMGENPNTGNRATENRITTGSGGVMDRTATRTGQVFDDVANRTTINPTETNGLITKLAQLDGDLDMTAGITRPMFRDHAISISCKTRRQRQRPLIWRGLPGTDQNTTRHR